MFLINELIKTPSGNMKTFSGVSLLPFGTNSLTTTVRFILLIFHWLVMLYTTYSYMIDYT